MLYLFFKDTVPSGHTLFIEGTEFYLKIYKKVETRNIFLIGVPFGIFFSNTFLKFSIFLDRAAFYFF